MEDETLRVLRAAADGSVALSSGSVLRPREVEVMRLMALGLRNQEIAARLFLSVHTVEYHSARIFQKLGVRNRTEAGLAAVRLGLLDEAAQPAQAPVRDAPFETLPAREPGKTGVLRRLARPMLSLKPSMRSMRVLKGVRSWLSGKVTFRLPRLALAGALLAALLLTGAKVTATYDLDERIIGRRLDTWILGYPPDYHCYDPTEPTTEPYGVHRPPPPVQVPVIGTDKTTAAVAGSVCAETEADLFAYFGRDPNARFCARTEPAPDLIREIEWIPLHELVPSSGAMCFESHQAAFVHFSGRQEPFCVRATPRPDSLEAIEWIPFSEPVPSSGAECFKIMEDVRQYFDIRPTIMLWPASPEATPPP